jgi:predicted nucleic acid-binding protein
MILADTSVWIDHLHRSDAAVSEKLAEGVMLMHPFVLGEISLGSLRDRGRVLGNLQLLPMCHVADPDEILLFVDRNGLAGSGIGYVDAHLLASTLVTRGSSLWTRDKRLNAVAMRLGIAASVTN